MKQQSNCNKFLLLWSGELVSAIGSGLTSFGLGVYVFQKTGSAANMALVALLAFLPVLLLSAPAGVLADRYDRRILMMAGDGLSALGLIYILICMFTGGAELYQICIGVFISSVFSSLLEPSYRATVTDLLTKEEYSKASGMVSIAGSARYLISPLIAGLLLTVSDVKLLLIIDISTFFLTVICTAVVRKGIPSKPAEAEGTFLESFREGWAAINEKRGVMILIIVSSVMTCFMGAMQILAEPMILDFQSSKVLGIAETVCASGMLVSSVIIGARGLKKNFTGILSISLVLAGLSMVGFGLKENILMICGFGFMFFFMLPFANNCLDYLVRTNIDAGKQGRAWGLISFLSQIGYVAAYGTAGLLADHAANAWHTGVGRGAAAVIMASGAMLAAAAAALYRSKDVRKLEEQGSESLGTSPDSRMIINDIKANKLVSAATCIFMAVTAMLLGLSILLYASLADSIDSLMTEAKTPDFLQMHTGELDKDAINSFAQQRDDVEAMQVCNFLNLQNSQISIGNESFENNMQDNGLSSQSSLFDYLVDADNKVIYPSEGEVYVPVCYRKEYGTEAGDVMRIGTEELTVAGFLRDSQMNSMMASSKRFLVSEPDYERLRTLGSEEYLIEFRLKDDSDINAFATAYKDAGLPDNGPTITYPLIRMMNALSDGMMILVILLVSVVVLLISIMCIRYIILTQLEKDKTGIGMLKAVGISRRDIRKLYMSKYIILSATGCLTGVIAAIITAKPVGAQMRELYGNAGNTGLIYALMILGSLAAEGVILLSVNRTLRRTDRISAADALYGRGSFGKKKNLWLPAMIITAAAVFMILVPQNMKSTIEAPEFVTYMGIGESHIRIDIRQTGNVRRIAGEVAEDIGHDNRVRDYVLMETGSYRTILADGSSYNLMIENGDHSIFPVRYTEGRYPENDREIALSVLNAEELGVKPGDTITVCREMKDGTAEEIACSVCGIYSDITNGGKTAKACMGDPDDATPVMWSIIYLSLADEHRAGEWTKEYQDRYSSFENGVKVTLIADYLKGTYGQTIRNISKAATVSAVMACFVLFIVMLLLVRLVLWRERNDSSLKKALGFTSSDIRMEYLKKTLTYILPGIVLGVFAGIIPGQSLAALLLRSMGAYSFRFIIDPLTVFAAAPAMTAVAAMFAAILSLTEVKRIYAWECLRAGK